EVLRPAALVDDATELFTAVRRDRRVLVGVPRVPEDRLVDELETALVDLDGHHERVAKPVRLVLARVPGPPEPSVREPAGGRPIAVLRVAVPETETPVAHRRAANSRTVVPRRCQVSAVRHVEMSDGIGVVVP